MSRVLRGAWSRRGTLATLVVMTAVVVAGVVAVLGVAEAAGTSRLLSLPLVLLGVVAVPETGRVLASRRREEIGLYRLRGVHGVRLLLTLLVEPLLAVVAGTLAGLGLGALVTALVTRSWLGEVATPVTVDALVVAALVALGALLVVAVGMASSLREPLSLQVSTAQRPRRATTTGIFLSVLVLVAAGVAAYRSGVGDDPDAVVLLGPALFGLAAGQITVWLVRLLARLATGRTAAGGLPAFLAVRRLARSADVAAPLRLLVAAGVVATVSLTGALAVTDWADDSARVRLAGTTFVPVDGGGLEALRLSRSLDPEGDHLMAVAALADDDDAVDRAVFVDSARYDAVVGDFLADTPAAPVRGASARLATGAEPAMFTGDRMRLEVRRLAGRPDSRLRLSVNYVNDENFTAMVELEGRFPADGVLSLEAPVTDCERGCVLRNIVVERLWWFRSWNNVTSWEPFPDSTLRLHLSELSLGEHDLLDQVYLPAPDMPDEQFGYGPASARKGRQLVVNRPDGVQVNEVALELVPESRTMPLPAVPAGGAGAVAPRRLRTPGSEERRTDSLDAVEALPFVGSGGLVADLPAALVADAPTVPTASVGIVVGEGAPGSMVDELVSRTGTTPLTADSVRDEITASSGARQALVYLMTALACVLIALLALASAVGRQRSEHRRDVAALRVVGVAVRTSRGAGRREVWLLGAIAALGVAAGGALAVHLLLENLPLLTVPPNSLPLDLGVAWLPLLLPAVLAAVAVVVLGARGRDVPELATRPATLRDLTGAGVVT